MKRLHPALQMPLAIALACMFSLGVFLLAARPQLEFRLADNKSLSSDLAARRTSLTLQRYQPMLDRLQRPLVNEPTVIRVLRDCVSPPMMKSVRYSFGVSREAALGDLPAVVQPLTITLAGMSPAMVREFSQNFVSALPNQTQLASVTYEKNVEKPESSSARLEFEIYGAPR